MSEFIESLTGEQRALFGALCDDFTHEIVATANKFVEQVNNSPVAKEGGHNPADLGRAIIGNMAMRGNIALAYGVMSMFKIDESTLDEVKQGIAEIMASGFEQAIRALLEETNVRVDRKTMPNGDEIALVVVNDADTLPAEKTQMAATPEGLAALKRSSH